jgi:ATP-dependent protease ClpP protease subunit
MLNCLKKWTMCRLVMILITIIWSVHQANAMDFHYDIAKTSMGDYVAIEMTGQIFLNDEIKFSRFIDNNTKAINELANNRSLNILYSLHSSGGNVGAALGMARIISESKIPTAVVDDHECASSCFILFAASPIRYASADVFIGVHSPSDMAGNENSGTMAMNVIIARSLQGFGIPSSILGEMIVTPPDGIYKLTRQDITSMGAQDIAVLETLPAPGPALAFTFPGNPSTPSTANDFQIGLAARTAFQEWLVGLQHHDANDLGYQEGALWWTANRSVPNPGCEGKLGDLVVPDELNGELRRDNFLKGCRAAKVWLDPTDTRRKTSPEYRKGWNSYGEPQVATEPQVAALPPSTFTPMIEEPKQAMICGKRTTFNPTDLVWIGTWNNPAKLCGAVILNTKTSDTVYIYGGSLPWKQQHVRVQTSGTPITSFSFVDDDGSTFRFSDGGGGLSSLRAEFHGRTGGNLTGSFARYQ